MYIFVSNKRILGLKGDALLCFLVLRPIAEEIEFMQVLEKKKITVYKVSTFLSLKDNIY